MKLSTVLSSAIFAAIAKGAALSRRQNVAECFGDQGPNLNDCDSLIALLADTYEPDASGGVEIFDDHHALNCDIGIAWNDPNNRPTISRSDLTPYFDTIKKFCIIPSQSGGYAKSSDGLYTVRMTNDPLYNPPTKQRRQVDGDNSFTLNVLSHRIERPGFREKVGPSLPSGSSYTVTAGEANSVSVGASFELSGGFFEVFEAGVSTSFESTHEVSNSESTQISVECGSGKNGQIYWVPKWDHYQGTFEPSGTDGDVWNPLDDSNGDYMVECQG
ncbi:hypothetical protein ACLX1H_006010 [Fusarium chlamydosporum]